MITLTLNKPVGFKDDGTEITESKTYYCPKLKGRAAKVAFELRDNEKLKVENLADLDGETVDKLMEFVIDLFGRQFTEDDLLDGLSFELFLPTLLQCTTSVMNGVAAKLGEIPNGETE